MTVHDSQAQRVHQWGPYVLVVQPALDRALRDQLTVVPAADRDVVADTVMAGADDDQLWRVSPDGECIERWPMAVVFDNLIIAAVGLFEARIKPSTRAALHPDEVRDLVAQMRSAGGRWPYGGPHRQRLEAYAAALEQVADWPVRFFRSPPRDPKGLLDLRINVVLWTMQELRRAVRAAVKAGTDEPPGDYLQGAWAPFRRLEETAAAQGVPFPPIPSAKNLQARADRLPSKVLNHAATDLMAYVLHDVLTYGPFLPDGARRP
jgi:hypothetical protein